jgi:gliding motility-associated-like protein
LENNYNIEELFKSNLQNMEATPPAGGWEAIQAKMNLAGNTAATSATAVKTGLGFAKIAAIITVAVGTGLGVGYFAFKDNNKTTEQQTINDKQGTEETSLNTPAVIPANVELTELGSVNKNGKVVSIVEVKKGNETQKVLVEFLQNENNKDHSIVGQWLSNQKNNYSQDLINKLVQQLESNEEVATEVNTDNNNTNTNSEVKVQKLEDDAVIAGIKPSVWSGNAPLLVDFSNLTDAEEFEWNFGDKTNSISTESSPRHTFNEPGNYVIILKVKNKAGKVMNDKVLIEVTDKKDVASNEEESAITKKTNVFSPNDDGQNDIYLIQGKNIESFQITISDQKGNVLFTANDINRGWDGTDLKGNKVPEGNYTCVYSAVGKDKAVHKNRIIINLSR